MNTMNTILSGALLMTVSSASYAVAAGGPNCGWGNLLFKGATGIPSHVVAVTTNGTTGNNTFGITSGTNGCDASGKLTYGGRDMVQVSAIMDEFSEDVARGHGEALDTVAVMIGIQQGDRVAFSKALHENFTSIFTSENVTAEDAMLSVNEIMKSNRQLAKYSV
ncbi:MAG: DUF3015 domain-containing protein [Cycloclasticus sp.]|nr:DUF3015 domain-containing protein [Cycloclasticus sp.]